MSQLNLPRGGLSNVILSVLSTGDKYGYEILSQVKELSNGEIEIKQPTLYSTLARMEKQNFITSYWRDGDIGGKRHYYHITDFGKKHIMESENCISSSLFEPKSPENSIGIASTQKYDEISEDKKINELEPVKNIEEQNIETSNDENNTNFNQESNQKDDAVFITDKLDLEDIPKVKKIEVETNLPIDEVFVEKIKPNTENGQTAKINELYNKAIKNNGDSYSDINYNKLKERYSEMEIGFYQKETIPNIEVLKNNHKIPMNKLFWKYFILFVCIVFESLAVALSFYLTTGSLQYYYVYFIVPVIFAIPVIICLFNKKSFKEINNNSKILFLNLSICFIGIILCYSINMLFGMSLLNIAQYPTTFIYPSILLLNLIVMGIIDKNLIKKYC